ncbi:hypothetical protein MVEN_02448900 [Mycena venus]|uniref:Uncharacterized protein n=1 Tax=Mycena venus TaxID=2733690 RepID=A0A8H6WYQ6_9AGAR|nr:hypothetical protein MVEN_02448900 [Mycena venus]
MLQIPSSILSLVSLSSKGFVRIFGGLCISTQIVVTLVLSTEYTVTAVRATKTQAVEHVPTRCVLSNGMIPFPYIAAMGYATVIFASLFCILRAKGFTSSRPSNPDDHGPDFSLSFNRGATFTPNNIPPSPPSDPGSSLSTNQGRRRHPCRWFLWLFLILLALVSVGVYVFAVYYARSQPLPPSLLAFKSFVDEGLQWIQMGIPDLWASAATGISALTSQLVLHARKYTRIFPIVMASHSVGVLGNLAFRRVCRRVGTISLAMWTALTVVVFVPAFIIACIPQLRWIYWIHVPDLNVHDVKSVISALPFLATLNVVEIAMVAGPAVIYVATTCLWSVFVGLPRIRSMSTKVIRRLSCQHDRVFFLVFSLGVTVYLVAFSVFITFREHYITMHADAKQILWHSLSCLECRKQARGIFLFFFEQHQTWKATQIKKIPVLISGVQDAVVAGFSLSWGSLNWAHKLLIVAPAAIFYIYLDIMPVARRLWPIFWSRGRRRQCLISSSSHARLG